MELYIGNVTLNAAVSGSLIRKNEKVRVYLLARPYENAKGDVNTV